MCCRSALCGFLRFERCHKRSPRAPLPASFATAAARAPALAGLVASGHRPDYDDWHAAVHGTLDYDTYLHPDPALRAMLRSIPLPKWLFTNADRAHAHRCLARLGLEGVFDGLICFEDVMEAAERVGSRARSCGLVPTAMRGLPGAGDAARRGSSVGTQPRGACARFD